MAYQSIYDNMTYGTEAVDAIYKNFYVEDMLKSVASVPKAIYWQKMLEACAGAGGFRLIKF